MRGREAVSECLRSINVLFCQKKPATIIVHLFRFGLPEYGGTCMKIYMKIAIG